MSTRRILITGLSSDTGGRLAQALERRPEVDAIIGIDTDDPRHELHRTEFVRVSADHTLLRRIVTAAAIDTVIDTRLIADPLLAGVQTAREVNVQATRSILAACSGADSPVRKVVFKSSAHVYGFDPDAPAFLTEDMPPASGRRTELEKAIVDAEAAVAEFAGAAARGVTVTVVRLADPLGPELRGSHLALFGLPVIPSMLGFDPRWQFIDEDDVVGVLAHAARHDLPGTYNAAADGVLALSEIASLLGKSLLPVLPPWGTGFAAAQLRRLGLRIPLETIHHMRAGRGLDNRRLKASGYVLRYTSRESVLKLRAQQRLRPLLGRGPESYRYEREVEEFLRWSPSVHGAPTGGQEGDQFAAPDGYDELGEGELISLISSLEPDALRRLRSYELAHAARPRVLEALDRNLARRTSRR